MHSIKKAARREAWYGNNNDPNNRTYNVFGRLDTRPKRTRDVEQGLNHAHTENDEPTALETARKEQNTQQSGPHAGTSRHKAGTYGGTPKAARPWEASNEEQNIMTDEPENMDDAREIGSKNSTEKSDPSATRTTEPESMADSSVGPKSGDSGPRKRKFRKFLPFKHSGKEEEERTDEDESKGKKNRPKIPFMSQFKAVFGSWVNILLVFVPIGFIFRYVHFIPDEDTRHILIFVMNFLAIVPLAGMLSFATEELAMYIGETLGGLLNASFGNAVELIVGVIALKDGQILIVQTSLIGSMLSNLLLVLGMCFFFGGLKRTEQFFNVTVAQTAASLLALAIGSLIIPTAYVQFAKEDEGVVPASRGAAVMLLFIYGCYLVFQLHTHADIYNEPSQKVPKRQSGKKDAGEALKGLAAMGAAAGGTSGGQINSENLVHEDEDDDAETPQLSITGALVTLGGATILIAFCAEFMVGAIDTVAESVSKEFIGLILLPIVGNAAEHATAVTVAIKDKMDLAIGVAVGSSLQIALLVLPLMVLLNWWGVGAGPGLEHMTLSFDGFQVSVLFISIILVNYLINDGKSHWLEGMMLQVTYLIIAVMAWFYPAENLSGA